MSIVSEVRVTGLSKRTPCHPSMTWGPLVPRPRTKRPPDIFCRARADIANMAGERAPSCTTPVASRTRSVIAAM